MIFGIVCSSKKLFHKKFIFFTFTMDDAQGIKVLLINISTMLSGVFLERNKELFNKFSSLQLVRNLSALP